MQVQNKYLFCTCTNMLNCRTLVLLLAVLIGLSTSTLTSAKSTGLHQSLASKTSSSPRAGKSTRKDLRRFLPFSNQLQQESELQVMASSTSTPQPAGGLPDAVKLVIGAGGIYAAFLYYGSLQEDVFHYKAADGTKFSQAWFLQALEALANVIVGGIGLLLAGGTRGLPQEWFAVSGATQVCAKAFTSLALAKGVSFPVVTLAKSGKMVPVMLGSLLLGGARYSLREYASVLAIIAGTTIVSMGKGSKPGEAGSSVLGLTFIALSLACDGITGGVQKLLQEKSKAKGVKAKPYDMMFWTNLYMGITAVVLAVSLGELTSGLQFCAQNPVILNKILKFALCSAVGQSFIFYTISAFNPLVCTTVTTTRKVFSVLLSIFLKGHKMSSQGWAGITVASLGILSELADKSSSHKHKATSAAPPATGAGKQEESNKRK